MEQILLTLEEERSKIKNQIDLYAEQNKIVHKKYMRRYLNLIALIDTCFDVTMRFAEKSQLNIQYLSKKQEDVARYTNDPPIKYRIHFDRGLYPRGSTHYSFGACLEIYFGTQRMSLLFVSCHFEKKPMYQREPIDYLNLMIQERRRRPYI